MRIGVYPGSFNPVHKGHIKIARYLVRKDLVDRLLIVPTGSYWDKQDLLPVADRIRMLEYFENDRILIERELNELPYTWQLMRELQKRYPQDQLCLVLGADNLLHFERWKNYGELLGYPFLLIGRDGIDVPENMKRLNKSDWQLLRLKEMPVSSTYIREHLEDYDAIKDMIDVRVFRYLQKRQ